MEDLTKKHFDIIDGGVASAIFAGLNFLFITAYVMFVPYAVRLNFYGNLVGTLLLEAMFVLSAFIMAKFRGKNFVHAITLNKKVDFKMIGLCIAVVAACMLLFLPITNAFGYTLGGIGYKSTDVAFTSKPNLIVEYLINIVFVCAVPAFCEEVLFRGVILNSFRGVSKLAGILVSGFGFMLMHGNPEQTVYQLLLGIVLAIIVWETKNLWLSIIIHFLNNFVAITINLIGDLANTGAGGEGEDAGVTVSQVVILYVLGIILVFVAIVGIIWLAKYFKKLSDKANEPKQVVEAPSEQTEQAQDGSAEATTEPAANEAEVTEPPKQKPSILFIATSVLGYLAFTAYFVYEWVTTFFSHMI